MTRDNFDTTVNHSGGIGELESSDFLTGTRFYEFRGSTVAVRSGVEPFADSLSILLGDYQGSASIMMRASVDSVGTLVVATPQDADSATRSAYLPYGVRRGTSDLSIDRGWLNQVTDESDTGLVYLNARYFDPSLSRFVSPDPLFDPGDPRTLDPYRYADNNPILFQDATGLCSGCSPLQVALYGASISGSTSGMSAEMMIDAVRSGYTIPSSSENAPYSGSTGGKGTGGGATGTPSPGAKPPEVTDLDFDQNGDGIVEDWEWDYDPNVGPPPSCAGEYMLSCDTEIDNGDLDWLWWVLNFVRPDNLILGMSSWGLAEASGAECYYEPDRMMVVCAGASLGYIPDSGGTMVGNFFITPYTWEEIDALEAAGIDILDHEHNHQILEALIGTGSTTVAIAADEIPAQVGRWFGGDFPKGCNAVEEIADYEDGGYGTRCTD